MESPFGTFAGYLKFHRLETLNQIGIAAVNFAFPEFLALPDPIPEQLAGMRRHREMGADFVAWKDRPERRFAGDHTLPRSCFFSVCRNEDGDDSGTVAQELNAYRDPEKSGPVGAFDLMLKESRDALQITGRPRAEIAIFIRYRKWAERPGRKP